MDNYQSAKRLMENINQVFVGKEAVVENLLTAFLAGGHVLLEDVPGVGKTTLALALAKSMACRFGRIQFTPEKTLKEQTELLLMLKQRKRWAYIYCRICG